MRQNKQKSKQSVQGKTLRRLLESPPHTAHTARKLPLEIWPTSHKSGYSLPSASYLISQQISGNSLKIVLPNRFISCAKKVIAVVVVVVVVVVVGVGSKFHRWE